MLKLFRLSALALMATLSGCDEPGSTTDYKFSANIKYQGRGYTLSQNVKCSRKLTLSEADLTPRYQWQSSGTDTLAAKLDQDNTAFYRPRISCRNGQARAIPQPLAVISQHAEVTKLYLITNNTTSGIASLIGTQIEKIDGHLNPSEAPNEQAESSKQLLKNYPINFIEVTVAATPIDTRTMAIVSLNYYKRLRSITLAGSDPQNQINDAGGITRRFPFSITEGATTKPESLDFNGTTFEMPRSTQDGVRVFYASRPMGVADAAAPQQKALVQYKDASFELSGIQELYDPALSTVYVFKMTRAGGLSDVLYSFGNYNE